MWMTWPSSCTDLRKQPWQHTAWSDSARHLASTLSTTDAEPCESDNYTTACSGHLPTFQSVANNAKE
eukprot:2681154-Prorocentrum_lima.AAC.1